MGHIVTTKSMQDKKGEFVTKELVPYNFMLTNGDGWTGIFELIGYTEEEALQARQYIAAEVNDRMGEFSYDKDRENYNPGRSWVHRKEVWEKFLEPSGRFSYTYPERIILDDQLTDIDKLVSVDSRSRQLVLPIYQHHLDRYNRSGIRRVPCTMHFQLLLRANATYLIQVMRSLDLYTHLPIDMSIGWLMAKKFALRYDRECPTYYVMQIASLHAYKTDLDRRGIF